MTFLANNSDIKPARKFEKKWQHGVLDCCCLASKQFSTIALPDPLLKLTLESDSSPQFWLFNNSVSWFSASSFVLAFRVICLHIFCPHGLAIVAIMTRAPDENVSVSAFFIMANVSKSKNRPAFCSRISFKPQLSSFWFHDEATQLLYSLYNPIRSRMPPIICTMPPMGWTKLGSSRI